jgi:hypothetical protein
MVRKSNCRADVGSAILTTSYRYSVLLVTIGRRAVTDNRGDVLGLYRRFRHRDGSNWSLRIECFD